MNQNIARLDSLIDSWSNMTRSRDGKLGSTQILPLEVWEHLFKLRAERAVAKTKLIQLNVN